MIDPELLDILIRVQGELFMMWRDEKESISPRSRKILQGIIGEITLYLAAQSPTLSEGQETLGNGKANYSRPEGRLAISAKGSEASGRRPEGFYFLL